MPKVPGDSLSGLGVGSEAVQARVLWVKKQVAIFEPKRHSGDHRAQLEILDTYLSRLESGPGFELLQRGAFEKEIFEGLAMLLQDPDLIAIARRQISAGWDAAGALYLAIDSYAELFAQDELLAQRLADLKEFAEFVTRDSTGEPAGFSIPEIGRFVIVVEDLSVTDPSYFTKAVVGVISLRGGPTSHAALILRENSIPAVFGCHGARDLLDGQLVLVDPVGNRVLVDGNKYESTRPLSFTKVTAEPLIPVLANIGSLKDAVAAASSKASGVGLFRTELIYLEHRLRPSKPRQVLSYLDIFNAAPNGPITVRTIDPAEDKPVPFLKLSVQQEQDLGYLTLLHHRDFLVEQLESIEVARQQSGRQVLVMAPMIASSREAIEFAQLAGSIGEFEIGIMVETPSIAMAIRDLHGQLEFVSVGTNDLSQYLLKSDRLNPKPSGLLDYWHPELLGMLQKIALDSAEAGIQSGVCGESASDPTFAIVLAGLGFQSVSAAGSQVGMVRDALSAVDLQQARDTAQLALSQSSAESAKAAVLEALARVLDN